MKWIPDQTLGVIQVEMLLIYKKNKYMYKV